MKYHVLCATYRQDIAFKACVLKLQFIRFQLSDDWKVVQLLHDTIIIFYNFSLHFIAVINLWICWSFESFFMQKCQTFADFNLKNWTILLLFFVLYNYHHKQSEYFRLWMKIIVSFFSLLNKTMNCLMLSRIKDKTQVHIVWLYAYVSKDLTIIITKISLQMHFIFD